MLPFFESGRSSAKQSNQSSTPTALVQTPKEKSPEKTASAWGCSTPIGERKFLDQKTYIKTIKWTLGEMLSYDWLEAKRIKRSDGTTDHSAVIEELLQLGLDCFVDNFKRQYKDNISIIPRTVEIVEGYLILMQVFLNQEITNWEPSKHREFLGSMLTAAQENENSYALVDFLLRIGANPSAKNAIEDRSALEYAVDNKSWGIAKLLIKAGADTRSLESQNLMVKNLVAATKLEIELEANKLKEEAERVEREKKARRIQEQLVARQIEEFLGPKPVERSTPTTNPMADLLSFEDGSAQDSKPES